MTIRQFIVSRWASTSASSAPVRVRFAPSPTGELHLGSIRTAFYNFLWARKYGGAFVLRIEDTDTDRIVPGSDRRFLATLTHFGLTPDESPWHPGSFGPYRQSERLPIYREHAEELCTSGHAFKCFCSPERIQLLRRKLNAERTFVRYDGLCRAMGAEEALARERNGEPFVVRFKYEPGPVGVKDLVYGDWRFQSEEKDFILLKQDGYPTYHLACVVDDHLMQISNVIRGSEWLISTPKHLAIYEAFDWTPPAFAHLSLITTPDGRGKLSKRFDAAYAEFYRQNGYLPMGVLNFLVRNGSGFRNYEQHRHYTMEELIERFDERLLNQSEMKMDMGDLDRCGRMAFHQTADNELLPLIRDLFERLPEDARRSVDVSLLNEQYFRRVLHFLKLNEEAFSHLGTLVTGDFRFFFCRPQSARALLAHASGQQCAQLLEGLERLFADASEEQLSKVAEEIKAFAKQQGVPLKLVAKLFRLTMVDNVSGPPFQELVDFFGRDECRERFAYMRAMLEAEKEEEKQSGESAEGQRRLEK